jgi:hypothetical protein
MTRDEMIQLLVLSGVQYVDTFRGTLWIQKILEHGFAGYGNMPDAELAAEIKAQGLDGPADAEDDTGDMRGLDDDAELTTFVHRCKEEMQDW